MPVLDGVRRRAGEPRSVARLWPAGAGAVEGRPLAGPPNQPAVTGHEVHGDAAARLEPRRGLGGRQGPGGTTEAGDRRSVSGWPGSWTPEQRGEQRSEPARFWAWQPVGLNLFRTPSTVSPSGTRSVGQSVAVA